VAVAKINYFLFRIFQVPLLQIGMIGQSIDIVNYTSKGVNPQTGLYDFVRFKWGWKHNSRRQANYQGLIS
jgi:hypothetical protein